MIFQRINRTDPEKIFIVVKNSWSSASLTNREICGKVFDEVNQHKMGIDHSDDITILFFKFLGR